MIILIINFLALVVILYIYFISATTNRVSEDNRRLLPSNVLLVMLATLIAFGLFATWYVRLGLM
ncbi:MAG: hypothetical protein QGG54_17055 [Gammaproteobacteria bacterium]|jgi:hypothetical protein|nr:hypothetical protein [Gammaproteobacteria bacterium]MDP6535945.1 hypothetical protein [Gammaproteobacteria bacterium]MDP6734289.1 hypothetical protein [Gammaproteobacteria bacterium]HAJ76737.1 hypothetical protein [Gammaproteobacteria bacterium]|tara:strand:+ start:1863 stop:2054 length:192 start_codon:yes stop_codon:yes gene_type:complete